MSDLKVYRVTYDGNSWLSLSPDRYADSYSEVDLDEVTARELAELLDRDYENKNFHDFVGAHVGLSKLIGKVIGGDVVKTVIVQIAQLGGLAGLRDHNKESEGDE